MKTKKPIKKLPASFWSRLFSNFGTFTDSDFATSADPGGLRIITEAIPTAVHTMPAEVVTPTPVELLTRAAANLAAFTGAGVRTDESSGFRPGISV